MLRNVWDFSKDQKPFKLSGGNNDRNLRLRDDFDETFAQADASDEFQIDDQFDHVIREKTAAAASGGSLAGCWDSHAHVEGMSGISSFGNIQNLDVLKSEDTMRIFDRYSNEGHEVNTELPIYRQQKEILQKIAASKVSIITGPTGCGKTTQVPQYVLDDCWKNNKFCNIIVTQPRRLAAKSIASRVCQERGWPLGTLCSYQIGLSNKTSEDTRLLYCTAGVLLQKLLLSRDLSCYSHIFLDEVHERSLDLDFNMLVLRELMHRCDVKIILMSATMSHAPFQKYFQSTPVLSGQIQREVLLVEVAPQRQHEITILFLEQLDEPQVSLYDFDMMQPKCKDYLMQISARLLVKIDQLVDKGNNSGVLIFLPGILEIETLHCYLLEVEKEKKLKWLILPLHSSTPDEEQALVMRRTPPDTRKIILATNIAESSITVPDISFVIDFCLTKRLVIDEVTGLSRLTLRWASQHMCEQRAGRVGRVARGRVYRMVPEKFYRRQLHEHGEPDMLLAPLEVVVLQSKQLEMGEPLTVLARAMDPPPKEKVVRAIINLKEAGGMLLTVNGQYHKTDGDITFLGKIMHSLALDIKVSKLVALGYIFGVLEEASVIAAALSVQKVFTCPLNKKADAYKSVVLWAYGSCSDLMALLNLYQAYQKMLTTRELMANDDGGLREWAKSSYAELRSLKEMEIIIDDLLKRLRRMTIVPWNWKTTSLSNEERSTIIKFAIAGAFYPNYFTTANNEENGIKHEVEAVKVLAGRNPFNTVYLSNFPNQSQPGELYVRDIQNLFADCDRNNLPNISFDHVGEKVFVEFCPTSKSNNDSRFFLSHRIPQSVYRAINMRLLHVPLKIKLYMESRLKEFKGDSSQIDVSSILNPNKPQFENLRERSNLPSVKISAIDLVIRSKENPGHFMATYYNEDSSYYEMLDILINDTEHQPLVESPVVSALYIAHYQDRNVRVHVESVEERLQEAQVLLIDEGVRLKRLPLKFLQIPGDECKEVVYSTPARILECRLAKLQPARGLADTRRWSPDAMIAFEHLTFCERLCGKVYSVVDGVVRLELYADGKSVNKYLIEREFAEPAAEGYHSKKNNEVRGKFEVDPEIVALYDLEQRPSCWKPHPGVTSNDGFKIRELTLKGPRSPLEMSLKSVIHKYAECHVNVATTSVNSVILNETPEDTRAQLVVASHCMQSPSDAISLRNTTLMPDLPGLPGLIAVLFSPCVEYRTDFLELRYTSALCGLGVGPNGKSLFPSHDFDITFDVAFTKEDLETVNAIRKEMSSMLHLEQGVGFPDTSRISLVQAAERLVVNFKKLLKTRPAQQMSYPAVSICWGLTMPPLTWKQQTDVIFPPHYIPAITDMRETTENIHFLHQINMGLVPFKQTFCSICHDRIFEEKALRFHLSTSRHLDLEKELYGMEYEKKLMSSI